MRPTIWRVRVRRAIEAWVDVSATSSSQAEIEALKVPGVLSVFGQSAMRGDEQALADRPIGVEEG